MDDGFEFEVQWLCMRKRLRELIPDDVEREGVLVRAALCGLDPLEYIQSGREGARAEVQRAAAEQMELIKLESRAHGVARGVA